MKHYIRLNGKYTAAVENEKATLQFVREHLEKEKCPSKEVTRVVGELYSWFKRTGEKIANHTVTISGKDALTVSRVPKG